MNSDLLIEIILRQAKLSGFDHYLQLLKEEVSVDHSCYDMYWEQAGLPGRMYNEFWDGEDIEILYHQDPFQVEAEVKRWFEVTIPFMKNYCEIQAANVQLNKMPFM